jgi:glycosyltransferase involved in cell wall biosynthesis
MHSPTQYYWTRQDEYLKNPGFPIGFNWIAKLGLKFLEAPLKQWDRQAAKHPNFIITNSTHTQAMIKKYYRRDAVVIHPPVDVDRFKLKANPPSRHGFVIAGRQTPYKRFDLAIEACNLLKVPLIVIGNGPDHKRLEKMAGRTITFLSNVNDITIVSHFQSALGFIMPNLDDFGIVAVEALAAGTPVIAYKKGGALDYINDGKNGIFFERQTAKSLTTALETALNKNFDYEGIGESAEQFSVRNFKQLTKDYVNACLDEKGRYE